MSLNYNISTKTSKNPLKKRVKPKILIKILISQVKKRALTLMTLMTFLIKRTMKGPSPEQRRN